MAKYWMISLMHESLNAEDKHFLPMTVFTNMHPFDYMREFEDQVNGNLRELRKTTSSTKYSVFFELISYQEITEEEFNKYQSNPWLRKRLANADVLRLGLKKIT